MSVSPEMHRFPPTMISSLARLLWTLDWSP